MALVGHASKQAVQDPQKSSIGVEYTNSMFVIIFAIKNQLPKSLFIMLECFPCQPIPDFTAQALSITGPVSTYEIPSKAGSISFNC